MPHLSQHKLSKKIQAQLEQKLLDILNNVSQKKRRIILNELLTKTEKIMIAKRLGIIYLFSQDITAHEISQTLRISPSTVARYQNMIENKQLKEIEKWLKNQRGMAPIVELLADLVDIALNPKPIGKYLDENY